MQSTAFQKRAGPGRGAVLSEVGTQTHPEGSGLRHSQEFSLERSYWGFFFFFLCVLLNFFFSLKNCFNVYENQNTGLSWQKERIP